MHLLDMASRCTDVAGRAASRLDPLEVDLWSGGAQATWTTRKVADALAASGRARLRAAEREVTLDTPIGDALTPRLGRRRLAIVAALAQWRTLSGEQLAAFTGHSSKEGRINDPTVLWSAGVLDRGRIATSLAAARLPMLYRPLPGKRMDDLLDFLDYPEWLAVTGGRRITRGPRHDRHNLLAAELALRVAEFCDDIATVFGERLASQEILTHRPPRDWRSGKNHRAAGDAVLVRDDGLRIVIEMTASSAVGADEKVKRWAKAFSESGFDEEGTVVVFVEAAEASASNEVASKLRDLIGRAIRTWPGARRRQMDERFALARWTDWFPDTYLAADAMPRLAVQRPTGSGDDRWETADLLGPARIPFAPPDPEWFASSIDNSDLLYGVPDWLHGDRDAARERLWRWIAAKARDVDYVHRRR